MPLNKALIGKEYPASSTYEVGREKIREFALAIGDMNPVYHDETAAKAAGHDDIIAPPTFLTVLNFKYSPQLIGDPELGLNYMFVVHGEQDYEHVRPVRPGDRLVGKAKITDITARGKNEYLFTEARIETESGELVSIARSTIVSRGTAPQEG
ncbi:MAG TPA: MaoC family dehydratase N-terminal domain-containing protein [Actinomycetota bacterium]|nr:MaoC family dehydratase N-terminal domain-containing protein [Actinomycetota bacterium]